MSEKERAFWVALSQTPGIGPKTFFLLLKLFGSAKEVWEASRAQLEVAGVKERVITLLLRRRKAVSPHLYLESLARQGVAVICQGEALYPTLLSDIPSMPPVLFVRGSLTEADNRAIAVVGTRKPTSYGREVTDRLVLDLVRTGFTIVSGLARGVDGVAHRTALEAGGRTIGFLGGGIDKIYPAEHVGLATEMMQKGAVVSEFGPGFMPSRGNFPMRNRLISGMSLGVLVVEGLSKSGTKHTADHAMAQGRPVFIVPGPITSPMSSGPMDMLADGAVMVRSGEDIVKHLAEKGLIGCGQTSLPGPTWKSQLEFADEVEEVLFMLLEMEPMETGELIRRSTLDSSTVLTTLSMMELKGMVKSDGGEYRLSVG